MAGTEKKASGQEAGKSRDTLRDWENKLEDRLALHLASLNHPSLTLEWPVVDSMTIVKHYRLTDAIAPAIMESNCREMDRLRKILRRRCANCDHVVSSDSAKSFEVPFLGAVCSVCHDLYTALTFNTKMRNMNYFKQLHEKWEKDKNDDGSRGGWRDKAGM